VAGTSDQKGLTMADLIGALTPKAAPDQTFSAELFDKAMARLKHEKMLKTGRLPD
jgi:hypothetical protein